MEVLSERTANNVATLPIDARIALERRLMAKRTPKNSGIPRLTDRSCTAVSLAQQRLWVLETISPAGSAYNVPWTMRLRGHLNVTALQRAIDELIVRHEILRTTFHLVGDTPMQVVGDPAPFNMSVIDLTDRPSPVREDEAMSLLVAEAQRPFDLTCDAMLRGMLIRLDAEEHLLLLSMHHIATDGWSKEILFRELGVLYKAFCDGKASPLPEMALQYADFATWQRAWLQGDALDKQLSYWKQQLDGAPSMLTLYTDFPRPAIQSFGGASEQAPLPRSVADGLKALSRAEGVTTFMVLLAAFNVLVSRYSGQEDIVVGSPIAGRNRSEIEGLIGFFVNTLAIRTKLSGNPTFRQLVGRVRETTLGAYDHQDLPFEKLVEELNPERSMSHTPLFQVMFALQQHRSSDLWCGDVCMQYLRIATGTSRLDLSMTVVERNQELSVGLTYNTDLFSGETIRRMLMHFRNLVEAMVLTPDAPLAALTMLSDVESCQQIVDWNDCKIDFGRDRCIHELFEEQADRTPDAVAVIFETARLTYRELNSRANQVAHVLQQMGVGADHMVGLCIERSLEMVVGILGILKAGAAYVPLDPSYPTSRLALILSESAVHIVLTQRSLASKLPSTLEHIVNLNNDWTTISAFPDDNVSVRVSGDNLAYVIFTSGSTGKPKGVMYPHSGLVNTINWMQHRFGFTPQDRMLQKTPFNFDVSGWEFFWPLVTGAGLVIAVPEGHLDTDYLVRVIKDQGITAINLVPSMLNMFVEAPEVSSCSTLKHIFCAGEALTAASRDFVFSTLGAELHNIYGPTETNGVTHWTCPRESLESIIPIGRPIANTSVYVLDRKMRLLPAGAPGELYVGGANLARGYSNHPELTGERFVPDPFSGNPGERLYRTGDLCRYLSGGELEYLGRLDHQVKIRGMRIELGEVESVLQGHSAVRDSVVMAREDKPGDKRLVAYLAVDTASAPPITALRDYLSEKLPDYMIPSAFVMLESLPISPNGKVDRKALPAPDTQNLDQSYVAPRTSTEIAVAEIWCKVLGVAQVGVNDNFFDCGGHSLLAVRLISEIRQVFGQKLPFQLLFQSATIAAVARELDPELNSTCRANSNTVTPIKSGANRLPMFCVAAAEVNALGYVALGRSLGANQPLFVLQTHYRSNRDRPYTPEELQDLGAVHIRAMREVWPNGPYCLGGMCEGAHIAFEMARQLQAVGVEVLLLASFDAWPEQNTRSRFGWWLSGVFRAFAYYMSDSSINLSWLTQQIARLTLRSLRQFGMLIFKSRDGNTWEARYWPGRAFVPPRFDGTITVLRVAKQPQYRPKRRDLGWTEWATRGVEVHDISGEHGYLLREPHVHQVADALTEHLNRVHHTKLSSCNAADQTNIVTADRADTVLTACAGVS